MSTTNTSDRPPFRDPSLDIDARVDDLVGKLTVEEKILQTLYQAPAIERLGIEAYNWWNEALHGVARAGVATVFPQAIGMAASYDPDLLFEVATAISDEGRAKYHEFARHGDHGIYKGITFWSPNVNIFRDPRWGRGHETYGEDPFLTSRMGVAFVKGIQGDDPRYLKCVATPKHYVVHSGPEPERHSFDAIASKKDIEETYLPAFEACVVEGKAESVMGAYNRTNGEACCASPTLLGSILRERWGFEGYVVSDCGAIGDIYAHHKLVDTPEEAAALAVKNGCDLNCGFVYRDLTKAVEKGLITEADLDVAVRRLFRARMKLGMFDPDEQVPYASIPYEVNGSEEHRTLSLRMAEESIVLLKNEDRGGTPVLPIGPSTKRIAVIGPNAYDRDVLHANYFGTSARAVTILDGIREHAAANGATVTYAEGCHLYRSEPDMWGDKGGKGFSEAVIAAERSDVAVVVLGLSAELEGEEGSVAASDGGGDKMNLDLPGLQQKLLEAVAATGTPTVLVLVNGSPVTVGWAAENVAAILEVWYPGEEGGTATANVLFGRANPAGRLPLTFVHSLEDVPDFRDYSMRGRTYRYITKEPLFPFGFGLSYTTFEYGDLELSTTRTDGSEPVEVSVSVRNTGIRDGDEVVQLYLTNRNATVEVPVRRLAGFRRIFLAAGTSTTVSFSIGREDLSFVDDDGAKVFASGTVVLSVGPHQGDSRSVALSGVEALTAELELTFDG